MLSLSRPVLHDCANRVEVVDVRFANRECECRIIGGCETLVAFIRTRGELLASGSDRRCNLTRRGSAEHIAFRNGAVDGECNVDVGTDPWLDVLHLAHGEFFERLLLENCCANEASGRVVGLAKRDALRDEVVGEFSGVGVSPSCGDSSALAVDDESVEHRWNHAKTQREMLHRVEEWFFVLLQIFVVCEGEALEHGENVDEVGDLPSSLASNQFERIRIFLLRHKA